MDLEINGALVAKAAELLKTSEINPEFLRVIFAAGEIQLFDYLNYNTPIASAVYPDDTLSEGTLEGEWQVTIPQGVGVDYWKDSKETCSNCEVTVPLNEALNDEWIPYYYDFNEEKEKGTLCPACTKLLNVLYDEDSQTCFKPKEA